MGLANTKGAHAVEPLARKLGRSVVAKSLDDALKADVIFFAVRFLQFKDVASALSDWTGKILIDVTNAFQLPAEVMEAELNDRLSSEVNAERVLGTKLVKAFNQLPMNVLPSPVPAGGRRVVFISSDDEDASWAAFDLAIPRRVAPRLITRHLRPQTRRNAWWLPRYAYHCFPLLMAWERVLEGLYHPRRRITLVHSRIRPLMIYKNTD